MEQIHAQMTGRLNIVESSMGENSEKQNKAHLTVNDRLSFLEKIVGDSAEKHQAELVGVRSNMERMADHASQLESFKKAQTDFQKNLSNFISHHASHEERVKQSLGNVTEKVDTIMKN